MAREESALRLDSEGNRGWIGGVGEEDAELELEPEQWEVSRANERLVRA